MIQGIDYWDDMRIRDLEEQVYNHRKMMGFKNIPTTLYESLKETEKIFRKKIAFRDEWERSYSYEDFLKKVDDFATYVMKEKEVKRGDQVGILLHNSIEFCVAFYATQKIGAIAVLLPSKYRLPEIKKLIGKSDLKLLIYSETFEGWINDFALKQTALISTKDEVKGYGFEHLKNEISKNMIVETKLDDPALIMFTSGTTSESKGVVLRHFNLVNAVVVYQKVLGVTSSDITNIPVPIYHITGLVGLLGLFIHIGGTIHLYKQYDAKRILEGIKKHKITFMHGSPTVYYKLLELRKDYPTLKSLRILACGSSYMPIEKMKQIHQWLPWVKFQIIYGMTETSSPALIFPYDAPTSIYAGAAGKPIPGIDFKFLNEKKEMLQENQIGEIWVRGSVVTQNYYGIQSEVIDKDGWLNTGDMGYYNEEGYVYVVDRKKDMINRGGEKIWSIDVEDEIYHIQGIKDVAVVGIPDEMYGEVPVALVVKEKGVDLLEEDIIDQLTPRMARYKIPTKIQFIEEIPKTSGFKVDKKLIREWFIKEGIK